MLDRCFESVSPLPVLELARGAAASGFVRLPPLEAFEPGNQAIDGLATLVEIARRAGVRRVFEIGTYNGLTALTLAANLPEATVDTLDLAPGAAPTLPLSEADPENITGAVRRHYEGRDEAARVRQHFGDSAAFDFSPFRAAVDLVYVDGAHSRPYVENDTRAAFDMVSADGVVVWDDYWRRVPDVAAVLHDLRERRLFRLAGTRMVVWLSDAASERVLGADRR